MTKETHVFYSQDLDEVINMFKENNIQFIGEKLIQLTTHFYHDKEKMGLLLMVAIKLAELEKENAKMKESFEKIANADCEVDGYFSLKAVAYDVLRKIK